MKDRSTDVHFERMVDAIMSHLLVRFSHRPYINREEMKEVFGDIMTKRLDFHRWLRRVDNMPKKETLFWLDSVATVYERLRKGDVLEHLPSEDNR